MPVRQNKRKVIMKKFIKFIACATAATLSLGFAAGCTKTTVGTNYPNFINDAGASDKPVETSEKYVINVLSEGGMKLDGVRVTAKKNGETIKRAISSNGRIDLAVSLGEYDLEVDESTLPAGYYLNGKTYKTNATARDEVTIEIPSRPLAANETCTYSVGNIMKDFSITDYNGTTHRLSELLKTKKAVILNFWFVNCTWCRREFPALQRAYSRRTDIEILGLNVSDSNEDGKAYQDDNKLTFPMGSDTPGLNTLFGIEGCPTTVVIDRYGLIAMYHESAETDDTFWDNLFATYASDSYRQNIIAAGDDDPNHNQTSPDQIKPNVTMPSSATLEAAANGDGFKGTYHGDDNEYVWPWLAGKEENGSTYIYSSNKGYGNTYSIVYLDVEMKKGQVLTFDYYIDSEVDHDVMYVQVDEIMMNGEGWSDTGKQWKTCNLYVADRDKKVEVAFTFRKDAADPEGFNKEDCAKIRDIHLSDKSVITEPTDILRTCADGEITADNKYSYYVDPVRDSNGYWHVGSANGPYIYMTVNNITQWSDLHTGNNFELDGQSHANSLYMRTYYYYSSGSGNSFRVNIGGKDFTDTVQTYWSLQAVMPKPYYLIPVNDEVKDWAESFITEFEKEKNREAHEDEWLEFCFYYEHVGSENYDHGEDDVCESTRNRLHGYSIADSYEAFAKGDPALNADVKPEMYNEKTGRFIAKMDYPLATNNCVYFKFTAKTAGVYQIRSYTSGCSSSGVAPDLTVYSENGRRISSAGTPRDHDICKEPSKYEGFNHYIYLDEGETVYLAPETDGGTTGYYEFDIENKGESYDVMYIASTGDGMWIGSMDGSSMTYAAVSAKLDPDTNRWYRADRQGNIIYSQPIYIDMVFESRLYSDIPNSTFKSIEWLMDNQYISQLKYGNTYQTRFEQYLAQAKAVAGGDENDPMYGLVPADAYIVNVLNRFIEKYVDGSSGSTNGWLMFACYEEHFGK